MNSIFLSFTVTQKEHDGRGKQEDKENKILKTQNFASSPNSHP